MSGVRGEIRHGMSFSVAVGDCCSSLEPVGCIKCDAIRSSNPQEVKSEAEQLSEEFPVTFWGGKPASQLHQFL
jgi:hypothetical protein